MFLQVSFSVLDLETQVHILNTFVSPNHGSRWYRKPQSLLPDFREEVSQGSWFQQFYISFQKWDTLLDEYESLRKLEDWAQKVSGNKKSAASPTSRNHCNFILHKCHVPHNIDPSTTVASHPNATSSGCKKPWDGDGTG
jgi:hypothetical protein